MPFSLTPLGDLVEFDLPPPGGRSSRSRTTFRRIFLKPPSTTPIVFPARLERARTCARCADRITKITKRVSEGHQSCSSPTRRSTSCSRKATPALRRRPIRRTIEQHVEDPLSEAMLRGEFSPGTVLSVDVDDADVEKDGGSAAASGVQAGRECG